MGLFNHPLIKRIQRNHGLEHATIHILAKRHGSRRLALVGRSDWNGFTVYGPVDTTELSESAHEALHRLRQGEADLAIHPRCGTMLATTGILTGLAAFLAVSLDGGPLKRFRWSSVPLAVLAATGAAILAQPLGFILQKNYTTSGQPGDLQIIAITRQAHPNLTIHRIETAQ